MKSPAAWKDVVWGSGRCNFDRMNRCASFWVLLMGAAISAMAAAPVLTWEGRTMGTFYSVKIAGVAPDEKLTATLRTAIEQRFDELNRQMSHYLSDSELARFNAGTSIAPIKVSSEFAHVMRHALAVSRESGGLFDPTLGRLINLWGFGPTGGTGHIPNADEIAAARRACGARHVCITPQDEIQKDVSELQLNLSGAAKGYAADEAARLLRERGYTNVFVAISGEIVASGINADGHPWSVGIETPLYNATPGSRLSAVVPLAHGALSTSGDAHNYFRDERGRVYGHILDPRTGCPVTNNLASVTVLATNGLTADSLTKPLFILGLDRGLRWIDNHPAMAALFIIRNADGSFHLVPSKRFPAFEIPPSN